MGQLYWMEIMIQLSTRSVNVEVEDIEVAPTVFLKTTQTQTIYIIARLRNISSLFFHQCDTKKIKDTSYFKLPSLKSQVHGPQHGTMTKGQTLTVGPLTLSLRESFQIGSLLCSTKLTQNGKMLLMNQYFLLRLFSDYLQIAFTLFDNSQFVFTSIVELLGLLKWKSQVANLKIILPQVTNVKGEEIVKVRLPQVQKFFAILFIS